MEQAHATAVAITREIWYPQVLPISNGRFGWMMPPSLGRSLVVIAYAVVVTLLLTTDSIVHDAYYWERMGFRAAWVSVTQVPFIFLLGGKVNIVSLLLGSSYVDVNWLHRWVSRILFVTVTIHGSFFLAEWVRADFVRMELEMMPMVKYGLGLWAVLAWMNITSVLPLRRLCYEFFIFQHIASAVIFLWLLSVHVPSYATYNLWMAVAFWLTGRVFRASILVVRNVRIKNTKKRVGQPPTPTPFPQAVVELTIQPAGFPGKPGQHVLLGTTISPLEDHPFTIANFSNMHHGTLKLVIRARSGFTRRLYRRAVSLANSSLTAWMTGPFGNLPTWNAFESLLLISASTGASFTLPILETINNDPGCVQDVHLLLLFRYRSELDVYFPQIEEILAFQRQRRRASFKVEVAITGANEIEEDETTPAHQHVLSLSASGETEKVKEESLSDSNDPEAIHFSSGRPDIAGVIQRSVEASAGEISVVACGGPRLTSVIRNSVARLSDERAVHKGTGAQGIYLHVEDFG